MAERLNGFGSDFRETQNEVFAPGSSPPIGGHKHPPDKYPIDRRSARRPCRIVEASRMTQGHPEAESKDSHDQDRCGRNRDRQRTVPLH